MKIAIVICTLRRANSLARTLTSVAQSDPPQHADWSVVVVDNGNSAETQTVAASFRGRLPIEVLVEPKAGLAYARNAAVVGTACDYFIWTDDDVTVGKSWIREYEAAFESQPEAAFFGGPIRPRFEGNPPTWITACLPDLYTAFAGRDLSRDPERFDRDSTQLPFGANMAIRAEEQKRFRYDLALGRQPGLRILSGEESDCLTRICNAGGTGYWLPDAAVDHWIDRERQSIEYVRRYYHGVSFTRARMQLAGDPAIAWSETLNARWELIRSDALYFWGRMAGKPETWVKALKRSAKLRGQIAARRDVMAAGRSATGSRG